jgi:hypothetical protein
VEVVATGRNDGGGDARAEGSKHGKEKKEEEACTRLLNKSVKNVGLVEPMYRPTFFYTILLRT